MLWILFALAALTVFLLKKFVSKEPSDLDKVPQAGNLIQMLNLSPAEIWSRFRAISAKFGDRFVITSLFHSVLCTSRPEDMEVILSHPRNINKSVVYSFLEPWLGTGLLISTGAKWHKRRKILTPTFHFNILKSFTAVIEEKTRDMVDKLVEEGKEKPTLEVDILKVMSECTLYAICETAMGTKLDRNHTEKQTAYKQAVLAMGPLILNRIPRIWYWMDFIYYSLPVGWKFRENLKKVLTFADDVIAKKKKEKLLEHGITKEDDEIGTKKKMAMLDLLLEAEIKGEIDLEGIREEVNTFMFEGHDTTAMALSFAFLVLAERQDIQNKLFEEILSATGDDPHGVMTSSDLADMKYLDAFIKEALRLYPSVPVVARCVTEDMQLGDILVKKGTEVILLFYDLHRREDQFENALEFRPERFLENTQRHPFAYVPFSAGPRNCIGQRFALIELKCILSEVVRKFVLSKSPRTKTPTIQSDLILRTTEPIYLNFSRREYK